MNTDNPGEKPVATPPKDVTTQQLMIKLLEMEKRLILIEKKLTTPLISGDAGQVV